MYTAGKEALERALVLIDRVSEAVGMQLGLRKCAVPHLSKGRPVEGGESNLPGSLLLGKETLTNT